MQTSKTVLLIDDDPDDRELLQEALFTLDKEHRIVEARDGVDGLACLVVLDLNMPQMDGKATFMAIKADDALNEVPVVIFSTSSNQMDRLFFDRYRTAYLVKPIRIHELRNAATQMLELCTHSTRST